MVSLQGARSLWPFLVLAGAIGAAAALGAPPQRALPAVLAPPALLASAMALRSLAWQFAVVAGPALGGLLFAIDPVVPYATATALVLAGLGCTLAAARAGAPARRPPRPGSAACSRGSASCAAHP